MMTYLRTRLRKLFVITFLGLLLCEVSLAQQEDFSGGGPRRQLASIIYSGLGGAVLGLSTLSFYGRPQERLSNIAVGFAVGIIAGTVYITYQAAKHPSEFYAEQSASERAFAAVERKNEAPDLIEKPFVLNYNWKF